ncbi:MAG: sensor histidine kinase, partial [Rhodospirillales bacterium]|nr:sensor histidine kinase [Rhodospirillales bacterium]
QALTNLISNAVKFSPENGKVTTKTAIRRNKVIIEVMDQGPGIPDPFQERLFDRFSQADHSGKSGGTGLGLAIAKAIAEAHKGSIDFETAPSKGTTFRISLPARQTMT